VPDAAVTELGHVGFAEDDCAGGDRSFDDDVVFLWYEIRVGRRSRDGPDAFGADEVLDADGDAGKGADRLARRDGAIDLRGRPESELWGRRAEGVEHRFERVHPLQGRPCRLDGGDVAPEDRG
jgi:hypothetical protein